MHEHHHHHHDATTDRRALTIALFAAALAGRPTRGRWTFGCRRLEILAAQANGVLERMLRERFGLTHTTLQVDHGQPRLLTIERR